MKISDGLNVFFFEQATPECFSIFLKSLYFCSKKVCLEFWVSQCIVVVVSLKRNNDPQGNVEDGIEFPVDIL